MFVPRNLSTTLAFARSQFPAVVITGPRQSGKSTLLRHEAADASWATLDDPLERSFARQDPLGFLKRFSGPVVLDEIQQVPELLPLVKVAIDADRRPGRFLLSGSQQFQLMAGVGESLAGRAAILELLPFSLAERPAADLAQAIWLGGYPEAALHPERRDLWLRSYIATYLERDVRQLGGVANLRVFELFLELCAGRHGQELNMAALANECGVSAPTVKAWLGVLQASYVVALVQPWHRNSIKRLVKSPKLYFIDPALACSLTRQPSAEAALAGPMGGALVEGLVVVEAIKAFAELGEAPAIWFWRSSDGLEVDLLVQTRAGVLTVEVKRTATPTLRHGEPLRKVRELLGAQVAGPALVVCAVDREQALPFDGLALPWWQWPQWLRRYLRGAMEPGDC